MVLADNVRSLPTGRGERQAMIAPHHVAVYTVSWCSARHVHSLPPNHAAQHDLQRECIWQPTLNTHMYTGAGQASRILQQSSANMPVLQHNYYIKAPRQFVWRKSCTPLVAL